ncbi:hypothetical protein GCM10009836_25960 [Pseudonocardia ailaonensis]|uniref:HTH iclR-type domain-containing protein n=1 Tax=Pseudonocardia ailaonensis TaxID=367279 RepID=A0ABN2MZA0_9PSEU
MSAPALAAPSPPDSALQTIHRMHGVLQCFLPRDAQLTLADVSRSTALPVSTALRILRSLVVEDFLVRDGEYYRLSRTMVRWAAAIGDPVLDLRRAVAAPAAAIAGSTGLDVLVFVEEGIDAVCVASAHPGGVDRRIGDRVPMVRSIVGRVLYAQQAGGAHALLDIVDRAVDRAHPGRATSTAGRRRGAHELVGEIAGIRARGWAAARGGDGGRWRVCVPFTGPAASPPAAVVVEGETAPPSPGEIAELASTTLQLLGRDLVPVAR